MTEPSGLTEHQTFHLPREIRWFMDESPESPLTNDHDYFRKRVAIELCRFLAHALVETMTTVLYSFDLALKQGTTGYADASRPAYVDGRHIAHQLKHIGRELDAKLQKQIQVAKERTPSYVPTLERIIQRLNQTEEENRVFRFLCIYQVGPFFEFPNTKGLIGANGFQAGGRYVPLRNAFRMQHHQVSSMVTPTMLAHVFVDEGYLLSNIMTMFTAKSKWVVERCLPSISDPDENACSANESFKLVIMGLPLTPTQYHALESAAVQQSLAEDPEFLATDAGKAHMKTTANEDVTNQNDGINQPGNRIREALQKRDRSKKESVFDVLTMMTQDATPSKQSQIGTATPPSEIGAEDPAFSGMEEHRLSDPFAGTVMERAPSAVVEETQQSGGKTTDEQTDDDKMKTPYKTDLEYLEDQFQLLLKEKAVVRMKNILQECVQMGKEGDQQGGDEYFGFKEPRDQGKAETDLRKAKTRLTIQNELCKSRLRATHQTGTWYPRLEILTEALELTKFEKMVVLELVKGMVNPERNGDLTRSSSIGTLQEKFCASLEERMSCRRTFYKAGTLIREGIIFVSAADFMQDLSQMIVDIDRRMLDFIVGIETEFSEIVDGSHLYIPNISVDDVVLPDGDKKRILDMVKNFETVKKKRSEFEMEERYQYGFGQVLLLYGPPGTGKTMLANAIATAIQKKVLLINFPSLGQNTAGMVIKFLFREAKINKALLFFDECESLFMTRDSGSYHVNTILTELEKFDGLCVLATNRPCDIDEAMFRRINLAVEFKKPDHILRESIWRTLRPPKLPIAEDVNFSELAMKYELTGGFIKNAWLGALGLMVARNDDKVTQKDLQDAANVQIVGRLSMSDFDHKVTPTCGLDAVVVSNDIHDALRSIVQYSKAQSVLFGQWGFGKLHKSKGVSVMFCGPSGTGKTLAAEAIGFELGRPLKVVNMAELMSKWVGETGKNIESVFASARQQDAVLVFDEAEGLFGSRGDTTTTGRHDVVNVGLLLQFIENFNGVCIVITNMKDRIDTAFFRRFRFILTFEKPSRELRLKIWKSIIPQECPTSSDVTFESLADRFDVTGGQIKQILLRAATRAALRNEAKDRILTMADFEKSCKEELDKEQDRGTTTMYL